MSNNNIFYEEEGGLKRFVRRTVTIIEEEYVYREVVPYEVPVGFQNISTKLESLKEPIPDDLEERKELAKIIGLEGVPEKKMDAFEEILGLLDGFIGGEEEVDAVKVVKALRRRC